MFDTLRDNSRIIVYIVVVAFVISGGFMGYGAYLSNSGGGQAPNQSSSVIAEVNGREISQQEYFSLLQQQAPQSNLSSSQVIPFRYDILNLLIERKLVLSQAEEMGIKPEVTETEVEDNYQNILDQNEMTDQELAEALAEQGYTVGELRDDIKANLESNKTITETINAEVGEISVSDEEISNLYEQRYPQKGEEDITSSESEQDEQIENQSQAEEKPALAEVEDDLRQELKNDKRNKATNTWIKELKDSADIVINDPVLAAYHELENENYAKAEELFSNLVNSEQTNPVFYTYLADAYAGQEKIEKAEITYNNAVEKYPENIDLKFNYTQFLIEEEKNELALSQLDQISSLAEDDFMTHYRLFMMYSDLGADEEAQKSMEKIQSISQNMQQQTEVPTNQDAENIQEEAEALDQELEVDSNLNEENNN